MSNSFFRILSKPFEDEDYLPNEDRRSRSKIVPVKRGKTPDSFELWETFENEVTHFIETHSAQLHAHSVPGKFAPRSVGMEISNEAEVRAAIYMDCAQVVEVAMRTCFGTDYFIKSADSRFVRGNMDYAGLIKNPTTGGPETVMLPIEIKGPWQLNVRSWENLPGLMNSGEKASSRVRNAIAQIFMYMVLSETQYGVLCTKSTYFFFRRVGSPDEKHLEVSRTMCCNSTSPSVRQCWLYISHLALGAEGFPCQWVEVTPPELKWVRIDRPPPDNRSGAQGRRERRGGRRERGGGSGERAEGSGIITRSNTVSRGGSSRGNNTIEPTRSLPDDDNDNLSIEDWFFSLPDISLPSLELGEIIAKTAFSTVFSHKSNSSQVIKVYEFSETLDTLNQFRREIDAYICLADVHGVLVPRVFGYGASWGHFLGFITMEALGQPIVETNLDEGFSEALIDGLQMLHNRKVFHGDLNLGNILLINNEGSNEDSSESEISFSFRFVDFGESVSPCDATWLEHEKEEFQNYLNGCL